MDLKEKNNVLFAKSKKSGFWGKIQGVHTSVSLNERIRIPLKSIWYSGYLDDNDINIEYDIVAIFCESNRLSYDKKYIDYLKRNYNSCITIFFFMNSAVQLSKTRLTYIERTFDFIVTYDFEDSIRYGWYYYCGIYCKRHSNVSIPVKNDVLFIGRNKNRLPILRETYSILKRKGLVCEFYITDVDQDDILDDGINYNHFLPYEEVLNKVEESRILFENVQDSQTGCTLRTYEAIAYEKVLLSNNTTLKKTRIFDDKNMYFYNNTADICEMDFSQMVYDNNNIDAELLKPDHFIDFLEDIIDDKII